MPPETRLRVLRLAGHAGYEAYLRSTAWRDFRRFMIGLVGGACEDCGVSEAESMLLVLDVHHETYDRLGAELPDDVAVLCRACHEARHE